MLWKGAETRSVRCGRRDVQTPLSLPTVYCKNGKIPVIRPGHL